MLQLRPNAVKYINKIENIKRKRLKHNKRSSLGIKLFVSHCFQSPVSRGKPVPCPYALMISGLQKLLGTTRGLPASQFPSLDVELAVHQELSKQARGKAGRAAGLGGNLTEDKG